MNISEIYTVEYILADEEATIAFAKQFALTVPRGAIVALQGELGTGKTRFAQGLALALGVEEAVSSPTFALISEYEGRKGELFLHLDLYRLETEEAVAGLGLEELLEQADLTAVEWPERAGDILPQDVYKIQLFHISNGRRRLVVTVPGGWSQQILGSFRKIAGVSQIC